MPLTSGTRLGPYDVIAPLGAGGMGEVYRAHDSRLGRDIATHGFLSPALLEQGRREEAFQEAEREPDGPFRLWALAIVHHAMGHAAESQQSLDQLIEQFGVDASSQIAQVYAVRGDKDAAFQWLDRAIQHGDAVELKPARHLRSLHSDPRWGAFLRKMGLEVEESG